MEVLDWSDTTTFLFEAEVFRSMTSDSVRLSYPVIFGQALHFAVPANAEGFASRRKSTASPSFFRWGRRST